MDQEVYRMIQQMNDDTYARWASGQTAEAVSYTATRGSQTS